MKIEDFNERLRDAILVADGAMGSMLYEMLGPQRCLDELNVTQAEAVFRVHQTYIEAGAQIIETNTFGANRFKLGQLGLADRVSTFNQRGVKIAREAREAAKHEVLIAGSIGPLGAQQQVRGFPARRNPRYVSRTSRRPRRTRRRFISAGNFFVPRRVAHGH